MTNTDLMTPKEVLGSQVHLVNFNKQKLEHYSGLRQIILRRNKLGDNFAAGLQKALQYDKFLKSIDVCANRMSTTALSSIIKLSLAENNTLVAFDARMNKGTNDKILHQIALCLCKNLEKAKVKGIDIPKEFIRPELYSKGIPLNILHGIGLKHPDELGKKRGKSRSKSNAPSMKSGQNRSTFNVIGGVGGDPAVNSIHYSDNG